MTASKPNHENPAVSIMNHGAGSSLVWKRREASLLLIVSLIAWIAYLALLQLTFSPTTAIILTFIFLIAYAVMVYFYVRIFLKDDKSTGLIDKMKQLREKHYPPLSQEDCQSSGTDEIGYTFTALSMQPILDLHLPVLKLHRRFHNHMKLMKENDDNT